MAAHGFVSCSGPGVGAAPQHLPGATPALLAMMHDAYLADFQAELEIAVQDLACWQGVVAAGRLAEDAEHDTGGLMALWAARRDHSTARSLLLAN